MASGRRGGGAGPGEGGLPGAVGGKGHRGGDVGRREGRLWRDGGGRREGRGGQDPKGGAWGMGFVGDPPYTALSLPHPASPPPANTVEKQKYKHHFASDAVL